MNVESKQIIEYMVNMIKTPPYINAVKHRLKEYKGSIHKDLDYVIANKDSMTMKDWEDMYEKHADNPVSPVLQYILLSPVKDEFAECIARRITNLSYPVDASEMAHTLILALQCQKMPHDLVIRSCSFIDNKYKGQYECSAFIERNIHNIPLENQKAMLEYFLEEKKGVLKRKTLDYNVCLLLRGINDPDYLMSLVNKYPDAEHIRNNIIQNPYLSDEQKYELWDIGVDASALNIQCIPEDIANVVYESIMDAFDSEQINAANYRKAKKVVDKAEAKSFADAKNKLYTMITKEELTPDKEYALFMTLQGYDSRSANETMLAILRNTKNMAILNEIKNIKSVSARNTAYGNNNIPSHMVQERIEEIVNKNKKKESNKQLQSMAGEGHFLLKCIRNGMDVPQEAYHLLLINNQTDGETISEILSAPHIGKEMLKRFVDGDPKYSGMIADKGICATIAQMRLHIEEDIAPEEKPEFYRLIKTAYLMSHINYVLTPYNESIAKEAVERHNLHQKEILFNPQKEHPHLADVAKKVISYIEETNGEKEYDAKEKAARKTLYNLAYEAIILDKAKTTLDYNNCPAYYISLVAYYAMYEFGVNNRHSMEFYLNVDKLSEDIKPIYEAVINQVEINRDAFDGLSY